VAAQLLVAGADPRTVDRDGRPPLYLLAEEDHAKAAALLRAVIVSMLRARLDTLSSS